MSPYREPGRQREQKSELLPLIDRVLERIERTKLRKRPLRVGLSPDDFDGLAKSLGAFVQLGAQFVIHTARGAAIVLRVGHLSDGDIEITETP